MRLHPLLCRAPVLKGRLTGPRSATYVVTPPANGPWDVYNVTLCPVGPGACRASLYVDNTQCAFNGLAPLTSYVAKAVALRVVGGAGALRLAGGGRRLQQAVEAKSVTSNEAIVTIPAE